MPENYLGQIIATPYNFTPKDFAPCNGQLMPITVYQALFSLLGVRYGGDGRTTFGLPDMRGRTPVGAGNSADGGWQPAIPVQLGDRAGVEKVTLSAEHMPPHSHTLRATKADTTPVRNPATGVLGAGGSNNLYRDASDNMVKLEANSVAASAAAAGHENMQPFVVLNYFICINGIYPSRS